MYLIRKKHTFTIGNEASIATRIAELIFVLNQNEESARRLIRTLNRRSTGVRCESIVNQSTRPKWIRYATEQIHICRGGDENFKFQDRSLHSFFSSFSFRSALLFSFFFFFSLNHTTPGPWFYWKIRAEAERSGRELSEFTSAWTSLDRQL